MKKLAICPWCRDPPEMYKHRSKGRPYFRVRCMGNCPVRPRTYQCETEEIAEKIWNKCMKPNKEAKP